MWLHQDGRGGGGGEGIECRINLALASEGTTAWAKVEQSQPDMLFAVEQEA